jgi:hypothetical protein
VINVGKELDWISNISKCEPRSFPVKHNITLYAHNQEEIYFDQMVKVKVSHYRPEQALGDPFG